MSLAIHSDYPCHPGNYHTGRVKTVAYLVIHYVGATGGAQENTRYFHNNAGLQASAHYFVGHASEGAAIYASVPEKDTAWHCGAKTYHHPECRNDNSIGIELCCHQDTAGKWCFDPQTVDTAVKLARSLMEKYSIPVSHVVRHYDVTRKHCPALYVDDEKAWEGFLSRLSAQPRPKSLLELLLDFLRNLFK